MSAIRLEDILTLQDYELARDAFRREVMDVKKRRRVAVGPLITLVFENRQTVLFQIQEMLRIERIVRPEKVQEEIDVYRELLPGDGDLSATLFIEVTEPQEVQPTLDRFVGLDEAGRLVLRIGDRVVPARFAPGQSREDRISAVHYIRFGVGRPEALSRGPVRLEVNHAGYSAAAELSAETLEELRKDLAG
jgi:hypothetical protein